MTHPREPLDPATPEGAAAEQALNQVLAGVLVRLDREERERAGARCLTSTQTREPDTHFS